MKQYLSVKLLRYGVRLIAMSPIPLAMSGYLYYSTSKFLQTATRAEGRVVQHVESTFGEFKGYAPVFIFTDMTGSTHTVRSRAASDPPQHKINDRVSVLYNPHQANDARIESSYELWGGSIITGAISLSMILLGGIAILVAKRLKPANKAL